MEELRRIRISYCQATCKMASKYDDCKRNLTKSKMACVMNGARLHVTYAYSAIARLCRHERFGIVVDGEHTL